MLYLPENLIFVAIYLKILGYSVDFVGFSLDRCHKTSYHNIAVY